jgi:hypothetical protein
MLTVSVSIDRSVYLEFIYPRIVGRARAVDEEIIDWDEVRKLAE